MAEAPRDGRRRVFDDGKGADGGVDRVADFDDGVDAVVKLRRTLPAVTGEAAAVKPDDCGAGMVRKRAGDREAVEFAAVLFVKLQLHRMVIRSDLPGKMLPVTAHNGIILLENK